MISLDSMDSVRGSFSVSKANQIDINKIKTVNHSHSFVISVLNLKIISENINYNKNYYYKIQDYNYNNLSNFIISYH